MITDIYYVIPEIFISLSLMFLLLFGVFKKNSSSTVYSLKYININNINSLDFKCAIYR